MKKWIVCKSRKQIVPLLTLAITVSCAAVFAQRNTNPDAYYRAPSTMHGKTVVLPVGTTFEGRMDNNVGSRTSHQGERFTITLSSPVLANGVDVIIPAGSQVIGEVVEAIPSSRLPRDKNMPKPNGKLRVQLSGLHTPDGMTYPLVASMAGETIQMGRRSMNNPNLGGGIAYMGSAAGFEAVAPGMADKYRGRGGRGPQVVTKQQMMRDAIYGMGSGNPMERMAKPTIRSLVKRDHDLFIDSGSPITIRMDAPFKIGVNPVNPGEVVSGQENDTPEPFPGDSGSGRRFSPTRNPAALESPSAFPGDTTSGSAPPADAPPSQAPQQTPQAAPVEQPSSGPDNF